MIDRPGWIAGLAALIVAGYAVPYLLLSGVERWSGAFLFWLVFGLAVWVILVAAVMRWRPEASETENPGEAR